MTEVWIHDLKYGAGVKLQRGDIAEFHYQIAVSLDQLDSTTGLLQASWADGRTLSARLGSGVLRPEIDAALEGLPVGSDRRIVVPRGLWADVDSDLAISLVVVSVTPAAGAPEELGFDQIAVAVPWTEPETSNHLATDLVRILDEAIGTGKQSSNKLCRLKINEALHELLKTTIGQLPAGTLRYAVRDIGVSQSGEREVELAQSDARIIQTTLVGAE